MVRPAFVPSRNVGIEIHLTTGGTYHPFSGVVEPKISVGSANPFFNLTATAVQEQIELMHYLCDTLASGWRMDEAYGRPERGARRPGPAFLLVELSQPPGAAL